MADHAPNTGLDLVKALIGFDTTSCKSNLDLIDYVERMLERLGARCRRTYEPGGNKANLFASFGPDLDGGIVLSGHTDVVPVDGQDWSSDPFKPELREGLLYGRGACDMKGFLGVALGLAPEIARTRLAKPLHFALSYDEEVGCVGIKALLADLNAAGIKPALAIIGEPTLMRVVGAHKGGAVLQTYCRGKEHHSSAPEKGANAVMMAGEFVKLLDDVWADLREDRDARFDPPYSTLQANMISGGSAVNTLAREAVVTWEYRNLPDRDSDAIAEMVQTRAARQILPKYKARAQEAALDTSCQSRYPGLMLDESSPAVLLACELTGANQAEAVAYGTEAGFFQQAGIPAVVCGPGSIEQAHRGDEYCALSELSACETFLRKVVQKVSA